MSELIDLEPIGFDALTGYARDDLSEAFRVFLRSAEAIVAGEPSQRPAVVATDDLAAVARRALQSLEATRSDQHACAFFSSCFQPFRVRGTGFVTAYYEAVVDACAAPEGEFRTPVLSRPSDLITLNDNPISGESGETLTSARRLEDGSLGPYPDRRAIEDDPAFGVPIAYVRDRVELFLMQVQGSARLRFADGRELPLTYDGRNGRPYTSIGRLLIERGVLSAESMSLEALKTAIRAMGVGPGDAGALLLQENQSYVFFRRDESIERSSGPIGGEGVALTPGRSIAVDRSLWSYGLPFWITADMPWQDEDETRFERLMIAQDTGSAIIGPARADLFFGSGERAGHLAGRVRHAADFIVLLPRPQGGER